MPALLYYVADLAVGFGLPLVVTGLAVGPLRATSVAQLYWLGVALGLTWELPIFWSALASPTPLIQFVVPPPVHPSVLFVSHTLWDGGLFLAGMVIVAAIRGTDAARHPGAPELALLLAWGQLSALLVELSSVVCGGWAYDPTHRWNGSLFELRGESITLLPQLIWLAAPFAYWILVRWVFRERVCSEP
ncbi:MAG: hypothetical protein CME06_02425 [Gemmatimonadetes bacterium]|nr:hypothetical protein [Gemmatimonadota bacterium]